MQTHSLVPGFAAVAVSCGIVLFFFGLWHQSGLGISAWMGFVAALFVGIGLAVLLGLSAFVPAVATAFVAAGRSPIASVLLWVAVAVCVLFVGNAIAEPKRAFDYGFFV